MFILSIISVVYVDIVQSVAVVTTETCFPGASDSSWTGRWENGGRSYLQIPRDTWTLLEPLLATMMS